MPILLLYGLTVGNFILLRINAALCHFGNVASLDSPSNNVSDYLGKLTDNLCPFRKLPYTSCQITNSTTNIPFRCFHMANANCLIRGYTIRLTCRTLCYGMESIVLGMTGHIYITSSGKLYSPALLQL